MADRKDGGDGGMKTPHMMDWLEDPERLEKSVFLPGGGQAWDLGTTGKRRYVKTGEGKYVQWLEYHRLNPQIFTMAAALAKRLYRAHKGIGARQIMERFRWEMNERADRGSQPEFNLNNSHIPFYGRAFQYSGVVPVDLRMFKGMGGEPVWWAEYLLAEAEKVRNADPALSKQIEARGKAAMAASMRGTDEAPAFELP
jgi:hypothetical protein